MSATILTRELVRVAELYVAHTALKESSVSSYAMNDGKRLGAIRSGAADITTKRWEMAMAWFSENWPEDLQWPPDVRRPKRRETS